MKRAGGGVSLEGRSWKRGRFEETYRSGGNDHLALKMLMVIEVQLLLRAVVIRLE